MPRRNQEEIEAMWFSPGTTLYHATQTENLPKILKKGLLPFQPTLWSMGRGGERYGGGEIFVFTNKTDAILWAGRIGMGFYPMTWDTEEKVCVISIKSPKHDVWEFDPTGDPRRQDSLGLWLKRYTKVPPEFIKTVTIVSLNMLRNAIKRRDKARGY